MYCSSFTPNTIPVFLYYSISSIASSQKQQGHWYFSIVLWYCDHILLWLYGSICNSCYALYCCIYSSATIYNIRHSQRSTFYTIPVVLSFLPWLFTPYHTYLPFLYVIPLFSSMTTFCTLTFCYSLTNPYLFYIISIHDLHAMLLSCKTYTYKAELLMILWQLFLLL